MGSELIRHSEKLYYFYEIASLGSLHACARKLNLSPPTLSYSLKKLEQVTGVTLFERHPDGMTPTEAGEHLYNFCKRFFKELEDVSLRLTHPNSSPLVRIKVGTFPSIAIYFWPYLLAALKEDPSLSVSMTTNRSSEIQEALAKRDIDVAITVETGSRGGMIRHELYQDTYSVFASSKLKLQKITKARALDLTMMLIPGAIDKDGTSLRRHLHTWGVQFREEFELDSFDVIAEFISRNYGVGILPIRVARTHGKKLRSIKVEGGPPKKQFGRHRFFLSYRADLDLPQKLVDLLLVSARKAVAEI